MHHRGAFAGCGALFTACHDMLTGAMLSEPTSGANVAGEWLAWARGSRRRRVSEPSETTDASV
jgi:hypothetical protein